MPSDEKLIAYIYSEGEFLGLAEVKLKMLTRTGISFEELREAALALDAKTRSIDIHLAFDLSSEYFRELLEPLEEKEPK
jgi:hypothetical protein